MMKKFGLASAGIFAAMMASSAMAADKLTYYCSAQEDWCQLMANGFQDATGIKVNMTRKSSGETFAQIKAEASNPKGDVWWGGTGDPHLQAAEEGLTEPYVSPMRKELQDWAISQATSAGDKTIGIYSGALGYGYNSDLLAKNNLPVPACWKDLLKPEYKGHVQMANPNSSGTAYTTLATIVQLFGEDEGFAAFADDLRQSMSKVERRLGGVRHRAITELLEKAIRQHEQGSPELHREWIGHLLEQYYDPMYQYQLSRKKGRLVIRGSFNEVRDYLNSLSDSDLKG